MTRVPPDRASNVPVVHIIVLTWNYREVTADCLRSVLKMPYPNYEVLVVDNGSSDDTVEFVRRQFPGVTVIANSRNLGFAAGCNAGIRHALDEGAEYTLLLNNDTLVTPHLLGSLVGHAETLAGAGVLAPKIIHADGTGRVWFSGGRRNKLTLALEELQPEGEDSSHAGGVREVDYVLGTAMLVRREVFERVGLFDEAYFMYYEEMDFCLRVSAAGFKLYYVPEVSVQHHVAVSTSSQPAALHYHKARSSVLFYRKHTRGARWLVVVPFRLGSTIRTMARHARRREGAEARAYVEGLIDGATGAVRMPSHKKM